MLRFFGTNFSNSYSTGFDANCCTLIFAKGLPLALFYPRDSIVPV